VHKVRAANSRETIEVLGLKTMSVRTVGASALVLVLSASPAYGWGKVAQRIISWTAIRALPGDQQEQLRPYESALLDGATADDEDVRRIFVSQSVGETARAVAYEMSLLRTASRTGVDEYVAYRFGVLSQIVADLNEPFAGTEPLSGYGHEEIAELRRRYELDVDRALQGLRYGYKRRKPVYDTESYFVAARRYLQHAEFFLAQDYSSGQGFTEYGQRSLNLYFDNAVNAVADIWFTIIRQARSASFVEPQSSALRQFRIEAARYFLQTGKDEQASRAVAQLGQAGMMDAESEKRVADAYFDTERYSRAIAGYLRVLEEEPNWPDVRDRVSGYYYSLGSAYMKTGLLEEAQRAFQHVLTSDPQYRPARQALDTTIGMIAARDERLSRVRTRIKTARTFESRAERAASDRDYADAIVHLRRARDIYSEVTTEFRREYAVAQRTLASINDRIAKFSDTIIREAMALDTVAEQMVLAGSVNRAARDHAIKFANQVTRENHTKRTRELQQQFVREQREQI